MRLSLFLVLLPALVLAGACLPRPPDTPLHVRPTDGRPKSPAKPVGSLYSSVELRDGSGGTRQWQLAESSRLFFVVGVAARFGAPNIDYQPDPTSTVFGLGPYIRTALHRQNLDVARGSIPISGTLSIDGNRLDSARGDLALHLDALTLDEQSEDMGWSEDLKREVFGLPDSGRETAPVTLKSIRFGSGPRVGFQVQGEATFELAVEGIKKSKKVFMTARRSDWQRYRWTSYQPIDVTISEDFALVKVKDGLADSWDVKNIADLVSIQIDLELEAMN